MDAVSALGPYFAVDEIADGASGWRRLDRMLTPAALREQVAVTRAAVDPAGGLGESAADVRAIASTMVLGLFARLVSPAIGGAVGDGGAPLPDPGTLWLGYAPSGPVPLASSRPLGPADPFATVEQVLVPVGDAVREALGVPRTVLIGNMAAAVVGACEVAALARPELAGRAAGLRRALLTTDLLAGSGTVEGRFVRASCCQIHRLPMGYVCPNCILVAAGTKLVRERKGDVPAPPGGAPRRVLDFTKPPFR